MVPVPPSLAHWWRGWPWLWLWQRRRADAPWLIPGSSLSNPARWANLIKPSSAADELSAGFGAGWIWRRGTHTHGGPGGAAAAGASSSGRCGAADARGTLGHQVEKLRHGAGNSMWLCSSWGPGQGGGSPRPQRRKQTQGDGGGRDGKRQRWQHPRVPRRDLIWPWFGWWEQNWLLLSAPSIISCRGTSR